MTPADGTAHEDRTGRPGERIFQFRAEESARREEEELRNAFHYVESGGVCRL